MKSILASSLFLTLPAFLFAGESVITGTGRVSAPPDYVSLTINVSAECYKTPSEASQAADKVARQIFEFLKQSIDTSENSVDDVLSSGGYTQPYSRYTTDDDGKSRKTCVGTFQKQTSITFKTGTVKEFGVLFDAIQERVYADFQSPGASDDVPMTYATIGSPSTELFHATQKAKEKESQALAVKDAIEKFESMFVKQCAFTSYDIIGISEPNNAPREMGYARESAARSSSSESAPISFDSHWINTSVNVKFSFEGGRCTSL